MKTTLILFSVFTLTLSSFSFADDNGKTEDGVYVAKDVSLEKLNPQIEKYVQEVVMASYLNRIGEVTKNAVISQKINVVPQLVLLAIHEVGVEAFKSTSIKETLQETYRKALDIAHQQHREGVSAQQAEYTIRRTIEEELDPMEDTPIFRKIVEEVVRQAMIRQQQIAVQAAYQQALQQIAIRQKVMEEVIKQQLQQIYEEIAKQAVLEQQQGVYQSLY